MSLSSFVKRMKKTSDGVYTLRFQQRLELTENWMKHRKNDNELRRFLVMELNSIRIRLCHGIDKMVREVLDE